jgi:chromosome segregation ATPase
MGEFKADYPTKEERRLMDDVERVGRALAEEHDKVMTITAERDDYRDKYVGDLQAKQLEIDRYAGRVVDLEDELAEARARAKYAEEREEEAVTARQTLACDLHRAKVELAEARKLIGHVVAAMGPGAHRIGCECGGKNDPEHLTCGQLTAALRAAIDAGKDGE